jgi:hypothetical protein
VSGEWSGCGGYLLGAVEIRDVAIKPSDQLVASLFEPQVVIALAVAFVKADVDIVENLLDRTS